MRKTNLTRALAVLLSCTMTAGNVAAGGVLTSYAEEISDTENDTVEEAEDNASENEGQEEIAKTQTTVQKMLVLRKKQERMNPVRKILNQKTIVQKKKIQKITLGIVPKKILKMNLIAIQKMIPKMNPRQVQMNLRTMVQKKRKQIPKRIQKKRMSRKAVRMKLLKVQRMKLIRKKNHLTQKSLQKLRKAQKIQVMPEQALLEMEVA